MSDPDEAEVLARFRDRLSGIEAHVPEPPMLPAFQAGASVRLVRGHSSGPRTVAASIATLAAIIVVVVLILPVLLATDPRGTAGVGAGPSQTGSTFPVSPATTQSPFETPAVPTTSNPDPGITTAPSPTADASPSPARTHAGSGFAVPPAPIAGRFGHSAAWTGTVMLVSGGRLEDDDVAFTDGAAYDPTTGTWRVLPPSEHTGRFDASTVWTGQEMIVWGGTADEGSAYPPSGGAYDPATDSWRVLERPGLDAETYTFHEAVWSGRELIVWGGAQGRRDGSQTPFTDGAAYDPASDTWRDLAEAPLTPRQRHAAVWTGTEVIIWGGSGLMEQEGALSGGAAYDPSSDTWREIATGPFEAAGARDAVWTGSEMIVWRMRESDGRYVADGAAYDPATDTWRRLPASPLSPRASETTVWTGQEVVMWGGMTRDIVGDEGGAAGDGAAYKPSTDSWRDLAPSMLSSRYSHSAIWTGSLMIVWGGVVEDGEGFSDGAAYDPVADKWLTSENE